MSRSTVLALLLTLVGLAPAWAEDQPLEARVVAVQGDSVKLNRGSAQGVAEGQIFDLYHEAEVYMLPLTMGKEPLVLSQRRVGRVQVFSVDEQSSEARLISRERTPDGQLAELEVDMRALRNPSAVAPNMPPRFTQKSPSARVAWREEVHLQFRVANEQDEPVVYRWSASGGVLEDERTLSPVNTWIAPPQAGNYQVNVTATDLQGQEARETVTVSSTGVPDHYVPAQAQVQAVFSAASRYQRVLDVAFDNLGRRYVLERGKGGFLSTGSMAVRVELPDRDPVVLPVPDRDFSELVVSNPRREGGRWVPGALFALDQESHTVLRFGFGAPWGQVLRQTPLVLGNPEGGRGNGSFLDPVDLALSPGGDLLYVLDGGQRCVQVFDTDGRFLVSFGQPGRGELQLQQPVALAVGPGGDVQVLDNGRKRVVVYSGWRPAREYEVGAPDEDLVGIAIDPFSKVTYVLDRTHGWVRRYRDGQLAPPHYTPEPTAGKLSRLQQASRLRMEPTRVLWVADHDGDSVLRLDAEQMTVMGRTGGLELNGSLRIAGTPEGGVVTLDEEGKITCFDRQGWLVARFGGDGSIKQPIDLAVTGSGNIHVLDARQSLVYAFSRAGQPLGTLGEAGEGPQQLTGVRDLTAVADRSLLAVVQQRPNDNFNLLDPATGRSANRFGRDYTGKATPRFGCVTGTGQAPIYWTVADDEESVWRAPQNGHPVKLDLEFGEISDMECSVAGVVFVCDWDGESVYGLGPDGQVLLQLTRDALGSPWDLGVDDYGRLFVYDYGRQRILALGE